MRILVVANFNTGHFSPFVVEQVDSIRKLGVEFEYFGVVGKGTLGYLKNLPALKRKIKEFRPDIVHAHYGLSGTLASLQNLVPVIVTYHNGETLSPVVNAISAIGSLRAAHTIYVAQHIRKLSYAKPKEYSIIPCGITLEDISLTPYSTARKELGFSPEKKYILFGGAFDNLRKNYPLLKEAIQLLPDNETIECIEMKGLKRSEINKLMCAVDCFALPTKSEGSPQALKEAMACNCPIVATDVADIKQLLGEIEGHYLCSFSPQSVAKCLRNAFEFGKRTHGRKRIIELQLTNNLVAQRVMNVYKQVLNES